MRRWSSFTGVALVALSFVACLPSEAPRVELPVVIDGSGVRAELTDLDWSVELHESRVVIRDLQFTTAGEVHERQVSNDLGLLGRLSRLIAPTAWAHPGHYQGGEIIGELPGTHVVDFVGDSGRELGVALLIVGDYTALNFGLGRAEDLDASDPLFGHTARLRGTASKTIAGALVEVAFEISIDSPLDREVVGAPFEATVDEASGFSIGLRMLTRDPLEGEALFDGIDFAALDEADGDADGSLSLVDPDEVDPSQPTALNDAYYAIRREFQTHDVFDAVPQIP